jgi:micrococcal nuclease
MYEYKAKVLSCHDGDTITVELDLGLRVRMTTTLRLYGINAPEVVGEQRGKGLEATEHLRSVILGKTVIVKTYKDRKEKYGRYLADVFLDVNQRSINEDMVAKGLAVAYKP